jgi:PAS domain S-box-containing protein
MTSLPDSALPARVLELVFDQMPDVAFFVKDAAGRYLHVNQSWVDRCGVPNKQAIIGRSARDLFPHDLAASYERQDREVLGGAHILNKLELHWHRHGRPGWCLTTKVPVTHGNGSVLGLMGISRDLQAEPGRDGIPEGVVRALDYLEANFNDTKVSPSLLARKAGLPLVKFARQLRRIFQLTPGQVIARKRLQAAAHRLRESSQTIAEIAIECGYCDHSAFTRAFRAATGMTPRQFREAP